MKTILVLLTALLMVATCAQAANTIQWQTQSLTNLYTHAGSPNKLSPWSTNSASVGDGVSAMVQLIYAGANGVADNPTGQLALGAATNGVAGDDVVVAWSWIGRTYPTASAPGHFTAASYSNNYANGSVFYIRAWEMPASANNTGLIGGTGVAGTILYYGDSQYFSVAGNGGTPAVDNFRINQEFSANNSSLTVIPEPGSLQLLMFLGTAFLMRRRMRKTIG